jgi:ABC-2 type transport system permease protein
MLRTFMLYCRLIGVQIRSQMQYRASFLIEFLGTGLIALLENASLALVFSRFQTMKGWTLGQVAFLYGLAETSFGLMDLIFSGFDPGTFGLRIRYGAFDQLLLRPMNVTLQVLSSEFTLHRFGRILIGIAIFISAINMVKITWIPLKILVVEGVIVGQVLFFGICSS